MRRGKQFSNRPKRLHEERRLALVPSKFLDEHLSARVVARMAAAEAGAYDASFKRGKRNGLKPWMSRAIYLEAYGIELRRGKWRERRWNREGRQFDRSYQADLDKAKKAAGSE